MRSALIAFLLLIVSLGVEAQENWGGKLGLSLQIGTHYRKLGGMFQVYYFNNFMQVNYGGYVHYFFRNLGPRGGGLEVVNFIDLQGHWGNSGIDKFTFNEFSNLAPHQNSAGYCFYLFISGNQTSQTTGAIHFTADALQIAIHNDALGLNQVDDKFRTGGFCIGYQVDSAIYSVQNTLWTGKSSDAPKIQGNDYPSKYGCKQPESALHGKNSHGILAVRADYYAGYKQSARAELGLDAEHIRHVIQNKFMHDGLLPLVVKSDNPHYPMLQEDGSGYYFQEGQKVKKPRLYFQLSSNQMSLY
jgi:hypothetical protein